MEGAVGESPKVNALSRVAVPPAVTAVTDTVAEVADVGLVKVNEVPSLLSVHVEIEVDPTVREVRPTKKEPFRVTVAPPVFGIMVLLTEAMVGDCVRA